MRTQTLSAGVRSGTSAPLGATVGLSGVNFSVFSKRASLVELLLFDDENDTQPARIIPLDAEEHRTYHYWHVFVPDIQSGQAYAYRAHGPFTPDRGYRFDAEKVLLDPYGLAVAVPKTYDRWAAARPGDNVATAMKSVVADPGRYDWEGDLPLKRPFAESVIYELHVGGFTRHPSSGLAPGERGTYAGLIQKIPYLKDLGVTALELLPVFQFDPQDAPAGRVNYWGYQPVSFFAPHHAYSSRKTPLTVLDEFRDMIKALHRAGLEVILDVVFNHTAEGDVTGPTLCYRGLANDLYYMLRRDKSRYADYTGCGNTLNANQPIVRRLIQDSLRYWVTQMHVDGFRFDLASILSRDENGRPLPNAPILWDIESDPLLAGTKLIAEAWDAAGLYQVGSFIGDAWQEWNGRFRDDVRRFLRGDNGSVPAAAARILGSPDIYGHEEREAEQSINFVTCHDGFTLNDLVSYNQKHNEANGENNRDGSDDNLSWNCGAEGPTDDPAIEALRNRQVRNFLALELLAAGTPMLLMGDEVRRTQRGNNNAYCQDSDISWFDWSLLERHSDIHRFVKALNAFRQRRDVVEGTALSLNEILNRARIEWHGVRLKHPDWSNHSHSLAFTLRSLRARFLLHGMLNAYWEPLTFELPPVPAECPQAWRRCIDTALKPPDDIYPWETAAVVGQARYVVQPRSVVLLAQALKRPA
ncbi:glycogen debranching protein GlgX [Bradyrhizobium liaoningense]|uniref:glycogen debranching protein GlgX n=1 Tax=Bradyrhizobium liaoningense TaxID=43992 RepID=UPI001BAC944F|nr:glycogen debranching protein GlgX [Bradyrhizobium liaoningense]MBR0740358.1 glycogen debranching protein GlgX [Bradyrhizobium liaoningense]